MSYVPAKILGNEEERNLRRNEFPNGWDMHRKLIQFFPVGLVGLWQGLAGSYSLNSSKPGRQ
jgi:hypothetical protein